MSVISRKINRYLNLVKKFRNWPAFIFFKMTARKNDSFVFKLRRSFSIRVPRKLLGPFREIFLDEIYLKHLPRGFLKNDQPTIIDIGANVGYFSLFMFSKYPKAHIHAFEPMEFNFGLLKQYQKENPELDFHIHQCALSDKEGTIDIYEDRLDDYTSMGSIVFTDRAKKTTVTSRRLDHFLKDSNIGKVDLAKLDCEGAEYSILYSLDNQLWPSITALTLETHRGQGKTENHTALVQFLENKKYKVMHAGKSEEEIGYIWAF